MKNISASEGCFLANALEGFFFIGALLPQSPV
jgi:hypothetical protein